MCLDKIVINRLIKQWDKIRSGVRRVTLVGVMLRNPNQY